MREYIDKLGHRPRLCVWELTLACNARCRHCGSHAGRPRPDELDTAQALRVAGELAELGCEHVTLSGGEPLLRPDWPRLAERLTADGVAVGMISNGLAFDAAAARAARDAGLTSVAFSIDGLGPVHDRMRGRAGSFPRTLEAFGAAAAAGLPAGAVTHVHRDNLDDLEELHGLLGGLGVRTWKLQLCNPAGEAAGLRDVLLRPRDLLRLVPEMLRLRRRGPPFVEPSDSIGYFGPYEQELRRTGRDELPFWTGCYAGCRVVGIESGGNVKGCLALPSERHGTDAFSEGNVRAAALADIWRRPGAFAYNREFARAQLTGFCRTCPYGAICRAGCHWTALSHGGTLTENRFCYYRVSVEAARSRRGARRWFARGLAPAAIVATLGVAGCYDSYERWADGGDASPAPDFVAAADAGPEEDVVPPADTAPDADSDGATRIYYGPVVPDADAAPVADADDVPMVFYGPAPFDAGTPEDATACPDPCGNVLMYGPRPTFPPGCPYECGGTEVCPTNPCCECDYGIPPVIPPECQDPCAPSGAGK